MKNDRSHRMTGIGPEPVFTPGRIILSQKVRATLSDQEIEDYLEAHTRLECDAYKMHWDIHLEMRFGGDLCIPSVFFHGPDYEDASHLLFVLTNCRRTRTVLRFAEETLKQKNWEKTCRKEGRRPVPGTWKQSDRFSR